MFENRMRHVVDGDYAPKSAVDIFVKRSGAGGGYRQHFPAAYHRFHHVYRRQQRRLR